MTNATPQAARSNPQELGDRSKVKLRHFGPSYKRMNERGFDDQSHFLVNLQKKCRGQLTAQATTVLHPLCDKRFA